MVEFGKQLRQQCVRVTLRLDFDRLLPGFNIKDVIVLFINCDLFGH